MTTARVVALLLTALVGTAVVLVRDLVQQALVYGLFGLLLALVFLLHQAPDAALAQAVVSGLVVPLLIFVTLAEIKGRAG